MKQQTVYSVKKIGRLEKLGCLLVPRTSLVSVSLVSINRDTNLEQVSIVLRFVDR